MKRTVTIDLRKLTDAPWQAADKVLFRLREGGFTVTATYPRSLLEVAVDEDGRASVELWCNAESLAEAKYVCTLPSGEAFEFTLPAGDSEISLEVLRALAAIPYTPSSEAAFMALLETHAEAEAAARAAAEAIFTLSVAEDTVLDLGAALRALILIDTTAGDVTVTLQPLAEMAGREIVCKIVAGDNLGIIDANGSETIDGHLVFNLEMRYQRARLMPGPTEWCLV
jgi:hypothetical protein